MELLEKNRVYRVTCNCEPQLGRRGLYAGISRRGSDQQIRDILNILAYADGTNDLIEISTIVGMPAKVICPITEILRAAGLLVEEAESG